MDGPAMHASPATTDTEEDPLEEPVFSSDDEELAAELAAELASDDEDSESVRLARQLQEEEYAALAAELACERAPVRRASGNVQLSHVPAEVVARVVSFCGNASLLALRHVSKGFAALAASESRERTTRRLQQALQSGFDADVAAKVAEQAANAAEGGAVTLEGAAAMAWRPRGPSPSRSSAPSSSGGSSGGSAWAHGVADAPPSEVLQVVASSLEVALAAVGSRYRSKCRQLLFNLADPKNPRLRQRLVAGEMDAAALVRLSAAEMASVELQSQRLAFKQNALRRVVKPDWRAGGFVCDLYRCASCDGYQTKLHRTIRAGKRTVDEVSTLYATCVACGSRWAVDQA